MTFDNTLPHALPWNYPWIKDEIERRDEYIAQLEAELAHQRPQNDANGAIEGESVKVPAEDESGAHKDSDSREKLEADIRRAADEMAEFTYGEKFINTNKILRWLDRQAAITERYWMQINGANASANIVLKKRIAELEAEHERIVQEMVDANTRQCERTNELTAERDEWKTRAEENSREKPKRKMLRIEQVLKERGMSQAKAARMSDVNESSMSRIVRGMEPPFPKRGQRIADVLGWEGDWRELFEEVEL